MLEGCLTASVGMITLKKRDVNVRYAYCCWGVPSFRPFSMDKTEKYILFKNHEFLLPHHPPLSFSPMVETLVLPCIHFIVKYQTAVEIK